VGELLRTRAQREYELPVDHDCSDRWRSKAFGPYRLSAWRQGTKAMQQEEAGNRLGGS
jgi:hypothetical protein